ncbi:hypothetical protein [Flavobacterium sp. UBA6135]|uniref:hypothetical protein n=1 Tax=Flavobacterium sp. UBA6135 TaxID=1946553 RepID=UPI0025BA2D1F|nr:hypothetical protein [Flavobacterium sp. UBA6135]
MQKIILYVAILLCAFATQLYGQVSFEEKAKVISQNIQKITAEEKEALKNEIEDINKLFENGVISKEKADADKLKAAELRAKNIETRVADEEQKLTLLVREQVDGTIATNTTQDTDTVRMGRNRLIITYERGDKDNKNYKACKPHYEKRTTSQFVFSFGLNNLITDGDLGSIEDSDFRFWGSHSYEWGLTYNTRIFKSDNLLHLKYGLSLMYNNLRATDNRYFVKNGNQTELQDFGLDLRESRFRNVQLVVPMHLEFDFTPKTIAEDGASRFKTHQSFRLGVGGFAGFNVKNKQILKYKEDDVRVKIKEKGDFNTNPIVYGLSTYIGYKETSLYLKYNLNTLFKDNPVDQNNISLGLRFDFN